MQLICNCIWRNRFQRRPVTPEVGAPTTVVGKRVGLAAQHPHNRSQEPKILEIRHAYDQ
jgi:hypothetical protein